jgi:DNA-binding MarR family transcriptional regulator
LRKHGYPEARDALAALFGEAAEAKGVPQMFNVTLTHCWTDLVAAALAVSPPLATLADVLTRHPHLADKDLPLRYYHRATLYSAAARAAFVEPDIGPLPPVPPDIAWGNTPLRTKVPRMPRSAAPKMLAAIPAIERATHAVGLFLGTRPDLDVSQAEAHVLAFLYHHDASRINDIHEAFGHRRSTLTSVLERLEKRRLLNRSVDPENRRSVVVKLTSRGAGLARRVFDALKSLEFQALKEIPEGDIAAFARVVEALATRATDGSRD